VGAAGDVNVHAGGHFKVQALGVATLAGGSEKNVPPPSAGAKRVPFAVLRINEPLAELLTKGAHIGIVDVDSPTAPSSSTRTVQLFVHTTDDPAISGLHLDKYGSTLTGNRIAVVGGGKEKESRLFLGQKGVTIFARGGANNDAGLNIALQVGKTKVVLDGKKIRMQAAGGKAVQVEVDGEGGAVNINSKGEINVKADTKITLHSAKVELNADVDIKGKLNGCDLTDQATAPVTVANSFNVNFAQAPSVVPAKTPAFPKEVFASETERKTYVQDTVRKHFVKIIDEVEKDLDMVKK
jgi:hypothetical protein